MKTIPARSGIARPVTDEVRDQAIAKGLERSQTVPHAVSVRYLKDRKAIELDFDDATAITLPLANYAELKHLSHQELERLTLGFGGSALCLDERDLHVSVAALIAASRPLADVAAAVTAARSMTAGSKVRVEEIEKAVSEIRNRLATLEKSEVAYWTRALDIPEATLQMALDRTPKTGPADGADGRTAATKRFRPA